MCKFRATLQVKDQQGVPDALRVLGLLEEKGARRKSIQAVDGSVFAEFEHSNLPPNTCRVAGWVKDVVGMQSNPNLQPAVCLV